MIMLCDVYLYTLVTGVSIDIIERMENNDHSVILDEIRMSDKAKSR